MADVNLFFNGDMLEPFNPYRGDSALIVPAGWAPWWVPPIEGRSTPSWQNQQPVFESRYIEGRLLPQISAPYATFVGGLAQQVPAVAGEKYELSVDCLGWSSEAAESGLIRDGSPLRAQVGVDPTGGLDGESPIIEWSPPAEPLGRWETLRLNVVSQAALMTVFLKGAPHLPKRQQSIFWRNALLRPVGRYKRATNIVGPGDTHIQLEPERPQPGQEIQVTISSMRKIESPAFWLWLPDGERGEPTFVDLAARDARHRWRYTFQVEQEGLYDLRFVGDEGARLFAQRLLRVAHEVQIVPSGRPRLDYTRVYVLLPPTADEQWLLAAARGSFDGRYTIGFSADDAGIGDVADRIVIAVNPHHWPETLTALWFQQHYPGTRFTAVVANKPADLELWLRDWMYES